MYRRRLLTVVSVFALTVAIAPWPTLALEPSPETAPDPIRIGMPAAMFRDVKPAMFAALAKPFYSMVEAQTGLKGDLVLVASPDEMRQQLNNGQLQLGVFHGFEFAWMQQKDPTLKPIMVAAPVHRPLKAYVVVSCNNNSANNLGDLRGKRLALANGTREHARIFVDRRCQNEGCTPSKFFDAITNPNTAETALHEVYDNKVQAAIVDGAALQCFAERYPARAKRLRAVAESQPFPMSVVAIHDGAIPPATLAKFKDGMVKANSTPVGRNLMGLMQMAGFEPVPADYNQQLADIVKLYPPPGEAPK
jgi:ABC-type phosphate/phosphonate transport system substrate-binding protein